MLDADRPPAGERLQSEIGGRLAALLPSALAGGSPDAVPVRPVTGRIVRLVPGLPTAVVSPGTGRRKERRKVSPVTSIETRAQKAARNEQLVRGRPVVAEADDRIELACECGDEACVSRVVLTADEYAFLRRVAGYFAVSPDHVVSEDHVIVGEPGRFAIVE
jgi:hypothetical protein